MIDKRRLWFYYLDSEEEYDPLTSMKNYDRILECKHEWVKYTTSDRIEPELGFMFNLIYKYYVSMLRLMGTDSCGFVIDEITKSTRPYDSIDLILECKDLTKTALETFYSDTQKINVVNHG